jgi:soluble lytic murein transglycosylase-like protein
MIQRTGIILITVLSILCPATAGADIYKYIDGSGIVHFTNVPTSSDYKLYIREIPEKMPLPAGTQKYDEMIRQAQKKHGVDFSLIKAVIKVESDFNPRAVSKKGAKGLMQIIPGNFKSLLVNDPFNPLQNIMGGALYLKRLLKRYENKLPLVLAAYNAGPDAVDRYQRIPPYTETQNYVRKVMKTYSRYKKS